MPLLLLLVVAVSAGLAAAFGTRFLPRSSVASPVAVATLVVGILLASVAVVVRRINVLSGLDTSAAEWGDLHASAWSNDAVTLVTDLAATWTLVAVAVVVAAIEIARTRNRWVVPFLLAVMVGNLLLTEAIKQLVDRARPDLEPVAATLGPAFPSGHSSAAAASWAAFALVAGRWWGPRAWPALAALAVGIAVAVAGSRVLLDVHWLTDALAGLALGWAWFAFCAIALGGRVLQRAQSGRGAPRKWP